MEMWCLDDTRRESWDLGWATYLGESMIQLARVGWRLLFACSNGASRRDSAITSAPIPFSNTASQIFSAFCYGVVVIDIDLVPGVWCVWCFVLLVLFVCVVLCCLFVCVFVCLCV